MINMRPLKVCPVHCSIIFSRFLGFLLWFVLGPGGLRKDPAGPGKAHGELWGASRGPPDPPVPRSVNLETRNCCRALLSGRVCVQTHLGRSTSSGPILRIAGPQHHCTYGAAKCQAGSPTALRCIVFALWRFDSACWPVGGGDFD